MKNLKNAIHLLAQVTAYHGSSIPDLQSLKSNKPQMQYGGDLGAGVYVSKNYGTARSYGPYVYKVLLNFQESDIFDLSAENQDIVEGLENTSVLVGEPIPPFYFYIHDQKYLITNDDKDTGAYLQSLEIFIENVPELESWVHTTLRIPDAYDLEDIPDSTEEFRLTVSSARKIAEDWEQKNQATILSLDEIGQEVNYAGYKALYFERSGSFPDEILVFDANDIQILEETHLSEEE